MNAAAISILRGRDGAPVPLQGVSANGRLNGLLFELTVEQHYKNDGNQNLEAVFTFPLPLRAVLLGFELEIGERRLQAVAIARQAATERYEKAIDEGDTAALIEDQGHGLYTVSLGNLLPGETAVIRYRYGELLEASAGFVRLNVPTVIAPRYGDPQDSGLSGPTVPGVDLFGEYPFEIRLELVGLSDAAGVRSPTHRIVTTTSEHALVVSLARNGFLDRDFVLELDQGIVSSEALVATDGEGYVILASPVLCLDVAERRPLALKVVLDCSGSMGGDSIVAARHALLAILERLGPDDFISITRFGSHVDQVTEGLEPADAHTLEPLKALVRQIDADLGGTELAAGLRAAFAIPVPRAASADLLLITDGEIYDVRVAVAQAARAGHRLFSIAIGAAPNEALARELADQTAGACDFISAGQDVEDSILRTFKRLRSAPRTLATVDWPMTPDWTAPLPTAVFPADTIHLFAGFATRPEGALRVAVRDEAGRDSTIRVPVANQLVSGDLLPRLAAARRLSAMDKDAAHELALRYQLATDQTSFVVVAERAEAEKAKLLPATVAVPHMLAAGWGGVAQVTSVQASYRHSLLAGSLSFCASNPSQTGDFPEATLKRVARTTPSKRSEQPDEKLEITVLFSAADQLALLRSLAATAKAGKDLPQALDDLASSHPIPRHVMDELRDIVSRTLSDEIEVVETFLVLLIKNAPEEFELASTYQLTLRIGAGVMGSRAHRRLRKMLRTRFFSSDLAAEVNVF